MDIRDKLKQYQEQQNLKLYQLAHKLNTTEATVSRWINKKNVVSPAWQELIKLKLGL